MRAQASLRRKISIALGWKNLEERIFFPDSSQCEENRRLKVSVYACAKTHRRKTKKQAAVREGRKAVTTLQPLVNPEAVEIKETRTTCRQHRLTRRCTVEAVHFCERANSATLHYGAFDSANEAADSWCYDMLRAGNRSSTEPNAYPLLLRIKIATVYMTLLPPEGHVGCVFMYRPSLGAAGMKKLVAS